MPTGVGEFNGNNAAAKKLHDMRVRKIGPQNIPYTILVNNVQQRRIHEYATKAGLRPSVYVQQIFDVAYGARIRHEQDLPIEDDDLAVALKMVLCLAGDFKADQIAKAVGMSPEFVEIVLGAWKHEASGRKNGIAATSAKKAKTA